MIQINRKQLFHYMVLPQLLPRIQGLLFSGFSYLAFFMAQTYRTVGLIPADHPYLNAANMGKFGIRHVIAQAASNLKWRRENADQVALFLLLLVGIVLLFAQLFILLVSVAFQTAYAGGWGGGFFDMFVTPNAHDDIAFVLMDRVFGLENFFVDAGGAGTCVAQGTSCFTGTLGTDPRAADIHYWTDYGRTTLETFVYPWPFHEALRQMFQIYSTGLLVIGMMIFCYFIFAVAAETAQSGTAFGRRFNHVWAPLRIVVAIGLLVPINQGLNSAQWILMYAAKSGSSFATNGWIMFNTDAVAGGGNLLGGPNAVLSRPGIPPVNTYLEFWTVLMTCKSAYERTYHELERPGGGVSRRAVEIDAWLVNPDVADPVPLRLLDTNFDEALEHFGGEDIVVTFGEDRRDLATGASDHQTRDGGIHPTCGRLKIEITGSSFDGNTRTPGVRTAHDLYYRALVRTMWWSATVDMGGGPPLELPDPLTAPSQMLNPIWSGQPSDLALYARNLGHNLASRYLPINHIPDAEMPDSEHLDEQRAGMEGYLEYVLQFAYDAQVNSPAWVEELSALGWGGAAVWYNRVAELNGSLATAVYAMPYVRNYPAVMERVRQARGGSDQDAGGSEMFRPYRGDGTPVILDDDAELQIAEALYQAQKLWRDHYSQVQASTNVFVDAVHAFLGTDGLMNIRQNQEDGVHPLAQLSMVGRTIIDSAIRNLAYSLGAGIAGGLANLMEPHVLGTLGATASGFLRSVAMIGITIGFVLFYIVPFLPFIYFFFAVGGWVKGIFEAMVGVPLWALAHIRIDGNGLPGDAALSGYFLILEIFLRPILILFGFIGSITIFAAQVHVLNDVWYLAVSNTAGFDTANAAADPESVGGLRYMRGIVDQFFFTVMYAIIVYLLAMSNFKLIDLVPNHILRWMGQSISTFGDQSGDPAQNLVRNTTVGAQMLGGQASEMLGSASKAPQATSNLLRGLSGRGTN